MRTVVGVFPSRDEADRVARELNALGIPADDVSIADGAGGDHREWSQRNIAACGGLSFGWFLAALVPMVAERGRVAAAGFGATVGGAAGILGGLVALAIPRSTMIVAGSPLATLFTAMVIGAAAGGLLATVYNMGVSHEDVPLESEAVREHGIVVAAHVDPQRAPEAILLMKEHGARRLQDAEDVWTASGWKGAHLKDEPYPSDSSIRSHQPN